MDDPNGSSNGPGLTNDEGVYTRYTWAHEHDQEDQVALDNLDKNITFRYACGQDGAGIDQMCIRDRNESITGTSTPADAAAKAQSTIDGILAE